MVSESTPSLPSRLGSTRPALPLDASTTTFSPDSAMPVMSTFRSSDPGVGVEDARREVQVADLAGEGTPVLLPREHAVQLALPAL